MNIAILVIWEDGATAQTHFIDVSKLQDVQMQAALTQKNELEFYGSNKFSFDVDELMEEIWDTKNAVRLPAQIEKFVTIWAG